MASSSSPSTSSSTTPLPNNNSSSSSTQTTTPMSSDKDLDLDLDSIGAHCQHPYCHILDFLPFRCPSCTRTFCLDHRSETAHSCAQAGAWARRQHSSSTSSRQATSASSNRSTPPKPHPPCSHPPCKTPLNTPTSIAIRCPICNLTYCLAHRLRESHACDSLPQPTTTTTSSLAQTQQKAHAAFSRLRLWSKEKASSATTSIRPTPKPSSAAARASALNALKRAAKGDGRIAVEKRVYVIVEAEAEAEAAKGGREGKVRRGEFFFSGEWRVGRMLDEAARGLGVENVNNRGGGEEERLRVFWVEGGRVLGFEERVAVVPSGETIVLLRGVGGGEG